MLDEVAIIGGGPSGLAAAHRLQQAGHRVRVLEAAERAGSKLSSGPRDGFVVDRGAFFIPSTYSHLLSIAEEIGLVPEPGGFVFAAARGGQLHRLDGNHLVGAFKDTALLSTRAKLEAARLAPELIRARRATSERITEAGRYDFESLRAWAERTQHPEVVEHLIDPAVRSMYAAEISSLSRVEFLGVIALFGGAKLVAFPGGMQTYGERLAATLPVTVGARVTDVRQTAGGAAVTVNGETEEYRGAIVALTARDAAAVRSDLDDWRAAYLRRVPAGLITLVNVALSARPTDTDATYAMISLSEHPHLSGIVFNANKATSRVPAGAELLTLCPTTGWSEAHGDQSDDAIAAQVLEMAERFVGPAAKDVVFTEVTRWRQQYPPVGHYAALGEYRARSARTDRTVHQCGEYLSAPQLDASTASGEQAAAALARHL